MGALNELFGLGGLGMGPGFAASREQERMLQQAQMGREHPIPWEMLIENLPPQIRVVCDRLIDEHPRKKVESRTLTPSEIAEQQIHNAVNSVKEIKL